MPPKRIVSAPANRVYKSSTPLHQTRLPEPKKRIKSYGKKSSVRIAKLDQDTLTQMDFVRWNDLPLEEDGEQAEKRRTKRRKTVGDEPSRTPQYYTQTLTQLDRSSGSANEEDGTIDYPSFEQSMKLPSEALGRAKGNFSLKACGPSAIPQASGVHPPQTPRRAFTQEIPSSRSPTTPMSVVSKGSAKQRAALTELSANTPIPFSAKGRPQGTSYKMPKLQIEDTYDDANEFSQEHRVPPTPSKRSSSTRSVRFALPDVNAMSQRDSPWIKRESTQDSRLQRASNPDVKVEISDSDAESDEDYEDVGTKSAQVNESENEENETQPATCYGEIGEETQFEAIKFLNPSGPNDTEAGDDIEGVGHTNQKQTQVMESQRLTTGHVNSMAPRTINSDIFISIHPQHVTNIVNRTKDHEMRIWSFQDTVVRIWIYETAPVSAVTYMAAIGPAKRPGEILDVRGIGNAEFNAKTGSNWRAYEILALYELADPVPISKLKSNEWLKAPPQKFAWVRPAVLGELMGNLKPPLFDKASEMAAPASSSSDTQEAEAQLLSTIAQFTQAALPSEPPSSPTIGTKPDTPEDPEAGPSTQQETPPLPRHFSQATTVDLSQTQTPRQQSLAEIIWESPTRPIPSSTPMDLPTPLSDALEYQGAESLVPFSMASSQLLTKSQMLPESLLNESVPRPPPIIQDSDDEDDD